MIVDTLMIILVYDTWLYDDKKKSYSMSETGENSATQGEVRQNKVRPQWVKDPLVEGGNLLIFQINF